MSAIALSIFGTLLSAASSWLVPWLQANVLSQVSKLGTLNLLDVVKSSRVGICAGAAAAIVAVFDRVVPDGLYTYLAVGVVAAVLDTAYRLRKGE